MVRRIAARVAAVARGWDVPRDQFLGALLEYAGRLAGGWVAHNHPVDGVGCVAVDAGLSESRRVRPAGMTVEAAHECRTVGDDRIEQGASGQPAGKRDVKPALAEDPGRVRNSRRVPGDRGLDPLERPQREQVDAIELVGALADVDVCVVEARRDQATVGLDHLCGGSAPGAQAFVLAADPGDPSIVDGDRVCRADGWRADVRAVRHGIAGPVCDEDPATDDQQVGRVAHRVRLASSADLTAGHSGAITLK